MDLNQNRKSPDGMFIPGFDGGYRSNSTNVTNQASFQAVTAATNGNKCNVAEL